MVWIEVGIDSGVRMVQDGMVPVLIAGLPLMPNDMAQLILCKMPLFTVFPLSRQDGQCKPSAE
jgi:hypothetical protein